ncbi:MAG: hypothetical protein P8186_17065 [Anaerolineae bacterium]
MHTFLDLSHTIEPGMSRFPSFDPPYIGAVWTHTDAAAQSHYRETTCEVTEVRFVTSIGTYLSRWRGHQPVGSVAACVAWLGSRSSASGCT